MSNYKLRYLPMFEDDLFEAAHYIAVKLGNPQAAENLIERTSKAILKRLEMPVSFMPYHVSSNSDNTYYRINIGNYSAFYVVIGEVMEVRRFIYGSRDLKKQLGI